MFVHEQIQVYSKCAVVKTGVVVEELTCDPQKQTLRQ